MTNLLPIQLSETGYYRVGDQFYDNKMQALYDASRHQQEVSWHFHDHVFSQINWRQRPTATLKQYYRERAQQIRDQYDWVCLAYSGGADSYTILHTFLENNIQLDEIYTRFPISGIRRYRAASLDSKNSNEDSEYEFAAKPVLDYVEKYHPEIKISFDDCTDMYELKDIPEFKVFNKNNYQAIRSYFGWGRLTEHMQQQIEHNRRVAFIQGHCKIDVQNIDGNYYAYFVDRMASEDVPGRCNEFFYWTADFPMLPVLQAHHVMDHLKHLEKINDPRLKNLTPNMLRRIENYRDIYSEAVYPDWKATTFQADKVPGSMVMPTEVWVKQHNPALYDSFHWTNQQWLSGIDPKYLKHFQPYGVVTGVINFRSCLYPLE